MTYPRFRKSIKLLWVLLFTVASLFSSYGQESNTNDQLDALLDELFFNEEKFIDEILESLTNYDVIYASVTYNSNTFYAGRDVGISQLSIMPQISYYSSKGFNVSVSGLYYGEFTPNWNFTNVSLGYSRYVGKKELLSYHVGYTRYFYSNGYDTLTNAFNANIGIRNKDRTLGVKVAGYYLFGNDQSYQVVPRAYGNFTLAKNKNIALKIRPQLNFIFGQQSAFTEETISPGNTVFNEEVYNGLLYTQANLPLSLVTKSWDLEIGYSVNFPEAVETGEDTDTAGFLCVSIGYLIDLGK